MCIYYFTYRQTRKLSIMVENLSFSDRLTLNKTGKIWLSAQPSDWENDQRLTSHSGTQHTHRHTHLTALFPGLSRWADTRKVKPNWILLEQETVSGSGISWAVCKSAPRYRQITTPAPHHSVFLQARCPSYRPTNSVKALKEYSSTPVLNTRKVI